MAANVPEVRVKADPKLEDGGFRADTLARLTLKESANRKSDLQSTVSNGADSKC